MSSYSNSFGYPKQRHKPLKRKSHKADSLSRLSLTAANATPQERAAFIRQTYSHLAGEIALFIVLEAIFLSTGLAQTFYYAVTGLRWSLIVVLPLILFALIITRDAAQIASSKITRYLGIGFYVAIVAAISNLGLYMLEMRGAGGFILEAAIVTIGLFLGFTAVAFLTRKDFSFLAPVLAIATFLTLGLFISGMIFGFTLRSFFALLFVALAGGWILSNTSAILHRYRTDEYIGASISLFSTIITIFWFILRYGSDSKKEY